MWAYLIDERIAPVNIFRGTKVRKARKGRRRTRTLSPLEIQTLWRELENPEVFGFTRDCATALRLILCTAARPGMVAGMLRADSSTSTSRSRRQ
jgi:hypothetical protein